MVIGIDNPAAAAAASSVLTRGGIAVLPTDTIYGISGIVPDPEERIRSVKGRGEDKPFLMLIADPAWIGPYSALPLPQRLRRFWPGPLTLIFPGREPGEKHAFRLPDDRFLAEVLKLTGRPLYSTSVNAAGESFLWRIDEIIERFASRTDLIVAAGDRPGTEPSTIIDLCTRPFTIVRQGGVAVKPELLA
jgi:L-threonylcarbamoyladenylate synthase